MRGYFGIGAYSPRTSENIGTLLRSGLEYDAAFMFTVAARCGIERQPSNTVRADRHIPFYCFPQFEDMVLPSGCRLVGVEQCEKSVPLEEFDHPEQAIYMLGSEDTGLPKHLWEYCTGGIVHISTKRCLNVAVAGSIVMYDRKLKGRAK